MTRLLRRTLTGRLEPAAPGQRLPQRVQDLIERQEHGSERLIGWAQLAVALTFAALYLVAPRPTDAGMAMYQPVPIALSAYLLFTAGRLLLSYRGFLPGWLVIASILTDMALLLGLIWAFHVQYGQPAAFALKIPTFIYVFVFIALRALRFDHRYVLSAGLFAAVGWLVLVTAAIEQSPPDAITRNFVDYLTSNHILVGAEFDKVFTILIVTAILTIAVWRARTTLVTAVSEQAASREIGRFLSAGVADVIRSSDTAVEAGQAAERNAAILMLDIRGFTRFSTTVSPTAVVDMLTSFHARILPIIRSNNGVVDKFLGDGVMATFGAVAPSEHAVADALTTLEQIMDEAERWRDAVVRGGMAMPLEVNGALAAGPIVFAILGNEDRLEYTVIGEAVNLAAKLEKHNKAEGCRALVSAAAYDQARTQGFEPVRLHRLIKARSVAGVPEPLDLVVIR